MPVNLLTDDTSLFPPFRYLYGEPVLGTAYVVFGVTVNQEQIRLPIVKQVSNVSWANKPSSPLDMCSTATFGMDLIPTNYTDTIADTDVSLVLIKASYVLSHWRENCFWKSKLTAADFSLP